MELGEGSRGGGKRCRIARVEELVVPPEEARALEVAEAILGEEEAPLALEGGEEEEEEEEEGGLQMVTFLMV